MTTMFAEDKFNPNPPTYVVNSNTFTSGSSLNLVTSGYLYPYGTVPSKIRYFKPKVNNHVIIIPGNCVFSN